MSRVKGVKYKTDSNCHIYGRKLEYSVCVYYNSARRWLLLSKIRDNRDSLRQFVRNKKGEIIGNTWLAKEICYAPCQHSFRTIRMVHSVEIASFFFFFFFKMKISRNPQFLSNPALHT